MRSDEVAKMVAGYVEEAQARVLGVGAEQYERDGDQKFETQDLPDLVEYAREECLDLVNYACFMLYRLDRLQVSMGRLEAELVLGKKQR